MQQAERDAVGRRVLVTWLDFDPDGETTGARLRAAGLDLRLAPKTGRRTSADVRALLDGAVAAIVSTDPFDREVFESAPGLCIVARVGVGTDSIDIDAASDAGVLVTTTPGANRETTADHALAMILAAIRRVVEHDAAVRKGAWSRGAAVMPWDLHGTTVGLLGCGEIGRAVARRLAGFGVEVIAHDPAIGALDELEDLRVEIVGFDDLLDRADLLSLHLPLTSATRGILGARELARLGSTAIVVNTARGGLIAEGALADALRTGRLRAAALDVFADEPQVPRELVALPNVVLTPHIGGLSERSVARMTELATTQVLAVLDGLTLPAGLVNPDVLTRLATTETAG
jgi:phosphoglycerate dehydrogenase-like enzyme